MEYEHNYENRVFSNVHVSFLPFLLTWFLPEHFSSAVEGVHQKKLQPENEFWKKKTQNPILIGDPNMFFLKMLKFHFNSLFLSKYVYIFVWRCWNCNLRILYCCLLKHGLFWKCWKFILVGFYIVFYQTMKLFNTLKFYFSRISYVFLQKMLTFHCNIILLENINILF